MHNAERKRRPRDGRECGMFSGGNIGADSRRLRLSINIHYYNAYAPSILCVGAARKVCLNSGKRIRRCRYISSDVAAHDYFKQKRARDGRTLVTIIVVYKPLRFLRASVRCLPIRLECANTLGCS